MQCGLYGGKFSIFTDSSIGITIVDGSMWEKSDWKRRVAIEVLRGKK